MKTNHHLSFFIIYLFTICVLFSACSEKKAEEKKQAAKTEVFTLQKEKLSSTLQLPGELLAYQQVDLYAKVTSFVKALKVDIGSEVKAGQLLIVLEAPELVSQLAAAESRLKSQEAVYSSSKITYDRLLEASRTAGTVSQNEVDLAFAKKNSDLSQLEAARAAHKEVQTIIGYLQIKAPFDGIISSRNANLGAYVGPAGKGSELPLFTLQEQKKLRLAVSIPEEYTSYMKLGDEVQFSVKSFPGETFTAKIRRKAGALDLRLRSERIEMDVTNNTKKLLPGMVTEVKLDMIPTDSTFIVPKKAVVSSAERTFVIRETADHKAEWVTVKRGREINGQVELYGALHNGDQLVKEASEEIREHSIL